MGTTRLSSLVSDQFLQKVGSCLDGGYLRIYDGVRPKDVEDEIIDQTLLAELRYGSPAFQFPRNGVISANEMFPETDAKARGRASWFRSLRSDGRTVVLDGSVGKDGDLSLTEVRIGKHDTVSVENHTLRLK